MAAPLTSGTLSPSTSEYTRLPDHHVLALHGLVLGEPLVGCNGWWFIVIMQNRWSSYSVIVLPGQCLYTSPGDEVLEVAAEGPVVRRHRRRDYGGPPPPAQPPTDCDPVAHATPICRPTDR